MFFITACAGRFCFAPYARLIFGIAPKAIVWRSLVFFITACAGRFYFAPYARVSFSSRRKRNQKGLPLPGPYAALRVPSLRRRSRGRAEGHPWPHPSPRLPAATTPYATTPLGLALKGRVDQKRRSKAGQKQVKSRPKAGQVLSLHGKLHFLKLSVELRPLHARPLITKLLIT